MFGTSGIRGIYGRDITEELALRVGNIFADGELYVARDLRASGIPLSLAVSAGALASGSDVIDAGIAPTPTLALAAKKSRGIMVTASHNPPEYNGLKLVEDGKEIGKALEKEVQEGVAGPLRKGELGDFSHNNECIRTHKELILSMVDADSVRKKSPRVIADCNGAAAVITPYLLSELGCRVVSVNSSLECFNRPSEPNEKNLEHLSALVRETGADFGIAHDGDGDRCVIIDEKGQMLPFDVQLAMMVEHELAQSTNRKIVSTVEASLTIREVVEGAGGQIEITPVGSTHVGEEIERSGALFGGEPCGEYIYGNGVHVPDAPMAVAKFAEIFSMNGKFSALRKNYRQNFMAREKFPAADKKAAVGKFKKSLCTGGKIRDDDGIRVDEEDGWFLVRASGTEPVVRLTMEYKTKKRLDEKREEIRNLLLRGI